MVAGTAINNNDRTNDHNHTSTRTSNAKRRDPNSVANFDAFVTRHLQLDWKVDFGSSRIKAKAVLSLRRLAEEEKTVKLDCSHLNVLRVSDGQSGRELPFTYDPQATKFGGMLCIDYDAAPSEFEIAYAGASWLCA